MRWMKFLKDYDCMINYHSDKANVITNTLSRKSMHALKAMNANLSFVEDALVHSRVGGANELGTKSD